MYTRWIKKSQEEIGSRIFKALETNMKFKEHNVLGIPSSYLDKKVFPQDLFFLKEAPFMSTLFNNPNHIGCHTLGDSESYFSGTQEIERELIEICSVDILKGQPGEQDGYVTSGGTEANLQAIWIYRNYFMKKLLAKRSEICILCSEDSHYSMDKGADIFMLDIFKVSTKNADRQVTRSNIRTAVLDAISKGKNHFIVIGNMMSTMFGSIDSIDNYVHVLNKLSVKFKIHIDAAFGGFYYPFIDNQNELTFNNSNIDSFTLDAHKMVQAPYGTGIFLVRKGYMQYANTKQASYVEGEDCTLIGSRSGANVIAVWMVLMKYGPFSWYEKIYTLQKRTEWLCNELSKLNVEFYRNSNSNIIAIKSEYIDKNLAKKYGLIPDNHSDPKWYKIVVMEHVTVGALMPLIETLKKILI
jgi:tyrosine decarboxylase / aspartate 1-decarboxylase